MMSWKATMYNTTKVTIELRDVVENGVDIWNFDYPSFYQGDEKKAFEQKVIDHYYFRQIGQETVGRFLHYFRTRIKEIMPYYAQLYKSVKIMDALDDPFGNVDITETFEEERSDSTNTTTNANSQAENRYSDTPQGSITNIDSYMTNASKDNSETEATVQGSGNGTVKHTLTRKGNQGVNTYAHDMKELRETYINIDKMIIDELNDLFLGVY